MNGELGERIAKLEEGFKSHSQRINKLESESEALIELKTIVKMTTALQERIHNEHSSQMNKFEATLNKVNDNLTVLNRSQEKLQSDLVSIGNRVEHIEVSNEDSKINIPSLITKIVVGLFMLIPSVVLAWILIHFNLK